MTDVTALGATLEQVHRWGASSAAAAVVGPAGDVLAATGDTDSPFAVASLTKLLVAHTTLVAVEEGGVSLDDAAGPPGSTLRHLMCHASGFDFDSERVLAEPGTRRIYSNVGYDAIAAHLHQRSGLRVEEYLHEGVLAPLGMHHSELRGSAAKDLHSSVDDLCRFAAELSRPTLIHDSTAASARSVQFPGLDGVLPGWGVQRPCDWGLGPELKGTKSPHWMGATAAASTFGHFGGSGTFLWVDPVVGIACVALTDRDFGDWAIDVWPAFSDEIRILFT